MEQNFGKNPRNIFTAINYFGFYDLFILQYGVNACGMMNLEKMVTSDVNVI